MIDTHAYYQSTKDDNCSTCGARAHAHATIGVCAYPSKRACPRGRSCKLTHGYEKATAEQAREQQAPPAEEPAGDAARTLTDGTHAKRIAGIVVISLTLAEWLDVLFARLANLERIDGEMPYPLTDVWPNVKALLPEGGLCGGGMQASPERAGPEGGLAGGKGA